MATPISRRRAYAVLALGCLAGAACAAVFDQVTLTISPEYFLEGKGLAGGDGLRSRVAWLGFRAGLPVGALVAGLGLLRAQRGAGFSWRDWLDKIGRTTGVALILGVLLMPAIDPFQVRAASALHWPDPIATRYLACWGLHAGAYFGVAAGLLRALLSSRRADSTSGDRSG